MNKTLFGANMQYKRNLDLKDFTSEDNSNVLEFSLASSEPYLRTDDEGTAYYEILTISEAAISFERLVDGKAPFLFEHDTEKQIGVIEKAFIADEKLKVIVRFSENNFAQEVLRDIKSGIRRNVSLGYIITDYEYNKNAAEDGTDIMYVTQWIPYEGSSVSVPADHSVGYKRNLTIEGETNMTIDENVNKGIEETTEAVEEQLNEETVEEVVEETTEEKTGIEEVETAEEVTSEEIVEETKEAEEIVDETAEIQALGELAGEEELAKECIEQQKSLDDFKAMIKQKRNVNKVNNNTQKGTQKMKNFSISKAIRNSCSQYKADISNDNETKISAENKRSMGVGEEFDVVVTKQQLRALNATATHGKELITGDYLPQEFTPALRPELTLEATGYHVIPVSGPSVSFAVVTSGATANMYDLDGTLSDGDLTFATKELKPRKEGVCIPIPYSLLLQGRPEVDAIIEQDIVNALAELRDKMILVGTGANNQPTGVVATAGVNGMDIDEIKTWAGICKAEQLIRATGDFGGLCWVMNGNNKAAFESTLKDEAGYGGYLCEDNKIKGFPVFVNNALDDNTVILGNFEQIVVADFDGLFIKVDDITYIKKGAVQVIATAAFDSLVRRPGSFVVTTAGE
jgi:HK97 family phage major capsid protein